MNKVKHVLLWLFSFWLCLNLSSVALANSTSSQVGIYFTEKMEEEDEDVQDNIDISNSLGKKSDGTSSYLPKTGEHKNRSFFVGNCLLIASLIIFVTSMSKKIEKRGNTNELKNDDSSRLNRKYGFDRIG